ncbi:MAG: hypothetical protein WC884_02870 [Candidatus Paceibacterota bacterium]
MIKVGKNKKNKCGYAILELLFYISFFAVLSLVVITSMITMARSFKETSIQAELVQSGNIMERISREIRASYDINTISANNLKLNIKDSDGVNKTVEFLLSNSDVQLLENDIFIGNLNAPNILISGLVFTQINTTKGKAVKIVFIVQSVNDALNRTQNFYNTIVLRGDY